MVGLHLPRLLQRFSYDRPSLYTLINAIPYMPISVRKTLLTTCRVQLVPIATTRLWQRARKLFVTPFTTGNLGPCTLNSLLLQCPNEVQSPTISGFISMMVRNLPFDIDEARESMESTVNKEISAAVNQYHPVSFDWHSILSSSRTYRHTHSLAPSYPLDPEMHDYIHDLLQTTKSRLSSTTFYPDYSNKTIGRIGKRCLLALQHLCEGLLSMTTLGLEILYV